MRTKIVKWNSARSFRMISCAGLLLFLSFNTIPVEKSPIKNKVSTFELYYTSINFQNRDVTQPSGYVKDYGKAFGTSSISAIGKTFNYGWKSVKTQAPLDISEDDPNNGNGVGRNRLGNDYTTASPAEQLEGTFIHFQGNHIAAWKDQPRGQEVYWELEVPNGYLEVTMSFGEKGIYTDSRHTATVEGYSIIAAFEPNPQETRTVTMLVEVKDGALTVESTGAYNSKLNFIKVEEIVHDDNAANAMLGFVPQTKNLSLITGVDQGTISTVLTGEGATSVGLIIQDDMIVEGGELLNANDWISLPPNPTIGKLDFAVDATGMMTGDTRSSSIIATAAGFKPTTFNASLAIVAGCSPLSLLPCNELVTTVPFNITFDGSQNGLKDANGVLTGLTTAAPHSASRLSEDQSASYPSVNGYEPSKIVVNNENLTLTATKGLAALGENRQVNTLGVALQNLDKPFLIETRILNLNMPATGDVQAGLNFGFNENFFVKLIVLNGNTIQLKKEIDSQSASGFNNADNITVENLDLLNKDVALQLVFDIQNKTVSAYYSLNGNEFMLLNFLGNTTLDVPDALMAGRTSPNELAGANLASIFASYNKASTSFNTTFDYFKSEDASEMLSTQQPKKSFTEFQVYPNPVKDNLNIRISAKHDDPIKTISIYDMQGRLVNTYDALSVRTSSGFKVVTGNLANGIYILRLKGINGSTVQAKFSKSN